ncbi:hypothetical protein JB92DRAFT_1660431 [Gautieria morchelliformis]|nr:hypothetical protein JB92DRAFT_1660431 [Gautieria morchelliformis]
MLGCVVVWLGSCDASGGASSLRIFASQGRLAFWPSSLVRSGVALYGILQCILSWQPRMHQRPAAQYELSPTLSKPCVPSWHPARRHRRLLHIRLSFVRMKV